jgi:hypothetical protein
MPFGCCTCICVPQQLKTGSSFPVCTEQINFCDISEFYLCVIKIILSECNELRTGLETVEMSFVMVHCLNYA